MYNSNNSSSNNGVSDNYTQTDLNNGNNSSNNVTLNDFFNQSSQTSNLNNNTNNVNNSNSLSSLFGVEIKDSVVNNVSSQQNGVVGTVQDLNVNTRQEQVVNNLEGVNEIQQEKSSFDINDSVDNNLNDQVKNDESSSLDDEQLLQAFIGNNYDKISANGFSFAGFFFTSLYMFYRKMFLYGLITFIINLIILNVISNFFVSMIFNVLIGLFINGIYLSYAKKKINKIKSENSNKSHNELKDICAAKGGTSIGRLLLGLIVEAIIVVIVLIVMLVTGLAVGIGKLFIGNSDGNYNGIMVYDSTVNLNDEFVISVPTPFQSTGANSNYKYGYQYRSNSGVFDSCSVSFGKVNDYSSAKNLISQMATFYDLEIQTPFSKLNVNNIEWYWFSKKDGMGTIYYYGMEKDNRVFLFEYQIESDAPSDCLSYKEKVLNSIMVK